MSAFGNLTFNLRTTIVSPDDPAYLTTRQQEKWDARLTPEQKEEALRFLYCMRMIKNCGYGGVNSERLLKGYREYVRTRKDLQIERRISKSWAMSLMQSDLMPAEIAFKRTMATS
jgi:predicted amidohydrolase YtcJ